MHTIKINELFGRINRFGRSFYDAEKEALFFNWTDGGIEFTFTGTLLLGAFSTHPDAHTVQVPGPPGMAITDSFPDYPWIAVFLDGSDVPYKKMTFTQDEESVLLFSSDVPETHTIRIIKLTENFRTFTGIRTFSFDGEFGDKPIEAFAGSIEFIGDSITCGFGLGTLEPERQFYAWDEDGWITHGALTARRLNLKPSFICISGITLAAYKMRMIPLSIEELYTYTDLPYEKAQGKEDHFTPWEFAEPMDYVVINLGTNDVNAALFSHGAVDGEAVYMERYLAFLHTLREKYGKDTKIICALGSIDYQYYNLIEKVVSRFREETGDDKIYSYKYRKMFVRGADVGGAGHPSKYKHVKMADELTALIESL